MKRFVLCAAAALSSPAALASPACVNPEATNFVLLNAYQGASLGRGGQLWLQNVATSERLLLRYCSGELENTCFYATNVKPGRYYFREVLPDVNNSLSYPVSTPRMWFEITGKGVDYIGDWTVTRSDRNDVRRIKVEHVLKHLDAMLRLCEITGKPLYVDKTREAAVELVD